MDNDDIDEEKSSGTKCKHETDGDSSKNSDDIKFDDNRYPGSESDSNSEYVTENDEFTDDTDDACESSETSDYMKGLVGLQNLGNTCYMNGALQALSNCQQLTRFVLDCPGYLKCKGLCHSYSELIKEIWNSKSTTYAIPTGIIRNIKCIYPAFRGCTQQDSQEFLRCFLEQLHDELKRPIRKYELVGSQENDEISQNSSDNLSQRSIISDTFEFRISSSVVCSSCNNISTTKETFKDLSIPIPSGDHPYYQSGIEDRVHPSEISRKRSLSIDSKDDANRYKTCDLIGKSIRISRNEDEGGGRSAEDADEDYDADDDDEDNNRTNLNSRLGDIQRSYLDPIPIAKWFWNWLYQLGSWFWGPQVTLHDCLSIFFGSDSLEGDNEYSCEVCTKKNKGVKYLKILDLPEVLCIHFKRYESIGSAKITTHVSFPTKGLDLAPFMSEDSKPQCTTYNLIACICHHGSAILNGHYTTYALNCYDDQWYEFDDNYVTCVQNYQVENSEAYILFYQKSSMDDTTERQRVKASKLLKRSLKSENTKKYFISKQWVTKFNTFVEPGPITNYDFLCEHEKVPKSIHHSVSDLCHPISKTVWKYLRKLHGGGPECHELVSCEICE